MTACTPEVITLQIGHYANFVGTHWWNIQESSFVYDSTAEVEIDHAVLFREGETLQQETTFTPRLLAVDLRGSLGRLRRRGRLYDSPPADVETEQLWQGATEQHKRVAAGSSRLRHHFDRLDADRDDDEKDVCQDEGPEHKCGERDTPTADADADIGRLAADEVEVWSDYLRTHLHPWSVHLLSEPTHANSGEPFDVFNYGESQYLREDFREDFEDRLRAYAEDCDHLVGFHVLADGFDGFGGVASGALSHLYDEYPRRPTLLVPVQPIAPAALSLSQAVHQTVNTVLTVDAGTQQTALCAPLSIQDNWTIPLVAPSQRRIENIKYMPDARYRSSALLAAVLDTITLPWRSKSGTIPLYEVASSLSQCGRMVASGSASLPLGIGRNDYLSTWLDDDKLKLSSLTPGVTEQSQVWSACAVLRGIPDGRLRRRPTPLDGDPWHELMSRRCLSRPLTLRSREPLSTVLPFPALFEPAVDRHGWLQPLKVNEEDVLSAPAAAVLESSRAVGDSLSTLHNTASRFNVAKFHRFAAAGLEADDFREVLERLDDLVTQYRPS